MAKKLFIMMTKGPEDTEMATIPFVMANAAIASGLDVLIGVQGNAVLLVRKGCPEHVFAANFPPFKELVETFLEAGGKIYVCGPCVKSRKIEETDMMEGAKVVNAPTFINEIMNSDKVLVY
ncbi:MAG: DsrE family protein [Candidatus Hydrothermae bacterium]|nr:DsrE family protein [Candidatus Hydrothermae bacterium]